LPLPDDYLVALEHLGRVFVAYEAETGSPAVLVGGAATAIYTGGAFLSGDFDIVASSDETLAALFTRFGFRKEERAGHLLIGFYHPDYPGLGFQQVTGPLFDGRADHARLRRFSVSTDSIVELPSIEDMIADRLAQHAIAPPSDTSRLEQARTLTALAEGLDIPYLMRRIADEGGDAALLGLSPSGSHTP
jgi:hypothetical protein